MYLSRVAIDEQNRQKIRDLSHLGAYHNWVEQSFPAEITASERSRHLWRIDRLKGQDFLLVLSQDKPNIIGLSEYGIEGTAEVKEYDSFLARLKKSELLRFRLTANPTYSVSLPGQRGKVYAHVTVAQQMQWLIGKANANGFELVPNAPIADESPTLAFDITQRDRPILRRKKGRTVHLSRVTYEGLLKITDLPRFHSALVHGIGREKAFGMGLMTVIPVE